MKYCKTCNLHYKDQQKNCIFCNNELVKMDSEENIAYAFPQYKKKNSSSFIFKLLCFLLFFASAVCMYLDFIYKNQHRFTWSILVFISSLYCIVLMYTIFKEGNWIAKFILSTLFTSVEVICIGLCIHHYHWAIDYVFPFSLMFNLIFLILILIVHKKSWYDVFYYLLCHCILGVIPSILNLCRVTKTTWPSTACLFISIAIFISLFFLKGNSSLKELKRRFHI